MKKQNRSTPKSILLTASTSRITSQKYELAKVQQKTQKSLTTVKPTTSELPTSYQVKDNLEVTIKVLNECMLKIMCEQKRNITLKQLIAILETKIKQFQENEKIKENIYNEEVRKKTNKIEYDIQQILQKYNEEIAKINRLKEETASFRSNRVVFSHLFKHIQEEIKHQESTYKELILRTEITRESQQQRNRNSLQAKRKTEQIIGKDDSCPIQKQPQNKMSNQTNMQNAESLFLTTVQGKINPARRNISKKPTRISSSSSSNSKFIKDLLEIQFCIDKIVKSAECYNAIEAIAYYSNVDLLNKQLVNDIEQEDAKIEEIEREIQRMHLERRISDLSETRQFGILQSLPTLKKLRSHKNFRKLPSKQIEKEEKEDIFQQISLLLGIQPQLQDDKLVIGNEILLSLERQLQDIIGISHQRPANQKTSAKDDIGLDYILSKMARFQNCDHILSKGQLLGESVRQLGKRIRIKK